MRAMPFGKRRRNAGVSRRPAGPAPWAQVLGPGYASVAAHLDAEQATGALGEVDRARIVGAVRKAAGDPAGTAGVMETIRTLGAAAFLHPSGQRDLPARFCAHDLERGQVRLGRATDEPRNPAQLQGRDFALDSVMLTTSLLACGPPGSGKTRGFAVPIAEHLCLQALANQASVVVIDPKGDDFAVPGMFDIDIDLANPAGPWGFDLYGGASSPEEAADRLASALLPPDISADKAYFIDASKNALYLALAPFHAANGRYPTVRQLLGMLAGEERLLQSVRDKLRSRGLLPDYEDLLATRERQRRRRDDPANSLVERVGLLNRPSLVSLLDSKQRTFSMRDINQPTRVRIALPEGIFPEAARMLARLAIAQFVQVCSSPQTNTAIFKGLVIDEAGRYVDDYVTRGVQRVRSHNAGLILLTQALDEFPEDLLPVIFSSVGCKALFAGVNPKDAEYFADFWGTRWVEELTLSSRAGQTSGLNEAHDSSTVGSGGVSFTHRPDTYFRSSTFSTGASVKQVERYLWSPSEITNDIPPGHALISLARPDGIRIPPVLVNLRA